MGLKHCFVISLFVFSVVACSITEVDNTLYEVDALTVEGVIRENEFASIWLTNSLAFEGVIDSLSIIKSIESKAKITLSDGAITEVLTLKKDESRFPFLFYRSNLIKGELDKEYQIDISIRGKNFFSNTVIPGKAIVQNLTFLKAFDDGVLTPDFRDLRFDILNVNPKQSNYYKLLIKRDSEDDFRFASPSIFSTENISATFFPLVVNYNEFINGEKQNLLRLGESFELRLVAISKDQFDFWKAVRGEESDILDNSAFSLEIPSNVTNGAFGFWSGENITSIKFTIPE